MWVCMRGMLPQTQEWTSVQPLQVGPPEAMAAQLSRMNLPKLVLAGNGMQVYKDRLSFARI